MNRIPGAETRYDESAPSGQPDSTTTIDTSGSDVERNKCTAQGGYIEAESGELCSGTSDFTRMKCRRKFRISDIVKT